MRNVGRLIAGWGGLAVALLGYFLLPDDLNSVPDAWAGWKSAYLAIGGPYILPWVLSVVLLGWLSWSELRPLIKAKLKPNPDIRAHSEIIMEAHPVALGNGRVIDDIQVIEFYLVITNDRKDRKNIQNVGAMLSCVGSPVELPVILSSAAGKSLRAGEIGRVKLGQVLAKSDNGIMFEPEKRRVSGKTIDFFRMNSHRGFPPSFEVADGLGKREFGMGHGVPFFVWLSADDTPPTILRFEHDVRVPSFKKMLWFEVVTD